MFTIMTRFALLAFAAFAIAPAALADPVFTPPPAKDGYSYPDCFCLNRGEKVPMGALSCLSVGGRTFEARCGMSLNTPIWRQTGDDCAPGAMSALPLTTPPPPATPPPARG